MLDDATITAPARPDAIAGLRHAAVAATRRVGLRNGVVHDIRLAVGEAATNVVLHAYPAGAPGRMTLEADLDGDALVLSVRDEGCGLQPRADSPGAGLGLAVILRVAQRVRIETPPDGGTVVRMWFGPRPRPG